MAADGVAFFDEPAQETGVFLDLSADHEKRRLYVVLSQGREDSGRGARVRAVVESERDPAPRGTRLAVGRQIRRKISGYRRGPDLSHIRRWVGRFGKGPGLHGRDVLHAPQLRNPGVVDERAQKKKSHDEGEHDGDASLHEATPAGAFESVGARLRDRLPRPPRGTPRFPSP